MYKLDVASALGCSDSGTVLVNVYLPLSIPNAFTPNGDGHNDNFYLLGGPTGSVIEDFVIFNRWGQRLFQEHSVPSGDPAYGWNGRINGALAPPETYVYMITLRLADGTRQSYKGTVILVR
jgi:gliding motility-associated-like protein